MMLIERFFIRIVNLLIPINVIFLIIDFFMFKESFLCFYKKEKYAFSKKLIFSKSNTNITKTLRDDLNNFFVFNFIFNKDPKNLIQYIK